jgi:hypothetical protein
MSRVSIIIPNLNGENLLPICLESLRAPIVGHKTYHFLKRVCLNFYKVRTIYFLAGILSAYLNLPYALKERKKIQASRKVSIDYLDSIMDKDFL